MQLRVCPAALSGRAARHELRVPRRLNPRSLTAWKCPTSSAQSSRGGAPWTSHNCRLALADGTVWHGSSFGGTGTKVSEVVFNTALSGYQEILSDPSYNGQFVLMTNPQIGNTGINGEDTEADVCHMGGLIIRQLSPIASNYRSRLSLGDYLAEQGIIGIYDLDTRAITKRLRETGALMGALSTDETISDDDLVRMAKNENIDGKDLISEVSHSTEFEWAEKTDTQWEFSLQLDVGEAAPYRVVALDFGVKSNILRRLRSHNCDVVVVPASTPASDILAMKPDGVLLSNGPGDPSAVPYAVETARDILGKVPTFGICMGHQILGQALGGKTFKLKFGHHGGNHPVMEMSSRKIEISSQNHNYAVDVKSLPPDVEVSHINLNDGTCSGLVSVPRMMMSVQYHPEASPGPHDGDYLFAQFTSMMSQHRCK